MNIRMFRSPAFCFAVLTSITSLASDGRVQEHRDLEYARVDGQSLKLDLYMPTDRDTKPPLIVWIHGGGWRGGSKSKVPISDVVDRGYALASLQYRFTDTAIFPAQIHDCKGAVRWLRAQADDYGYDADWIAVAGSSAGGHLALLMGTSGGVAELEGSVGGNLDQASTVQAVVDYFGPSDFVLRGKTQPERAYTEKSGSYALLGGVRNGNVDPRLERVASPAHHVDDSDPPLLVFHGVDDQTVLLDQSERIVAAYQHVGLRAKMITIENAGHGGAKFFNVENQQVLREFLDEHHEHRGR